MAKFIPYNERLYLKVSEAAGLLGVTPPIIYNEINAGILPAYHIGGKDDRLTLVKRQHLDWFMEGTLAAHLEMERAAAKAETTNGG